MILAIGSFPKWQPRCPLCTKDDPVCTHTTPESSWLYGNTALIFYSLAKDEDGQTYLTREVKAYPRSSVYTDKAHLQTAASNYCVRYQILTIPPKTIADARAMQKVMAKCSAFNIMWLDDTDGLWHKANGVWTKGIEPKLLKIGFDLQDDEHYEVVIKRNY